MNRVVAMLHIQRRLDSRVMQLRQLLGTQRRGVLPGLAPYGIIAKAIGELALGAIHLAVQVIAFDVTDDFPIQVDLMQITTAAI